jgi:serine/threonine protein kinase
MIGKTVGQYRLTRRLGEGGMGVVYLAEHRRRGDKAAVKLLRSDLARDRRLVKRFCNEARAAAAIRHRGIVEVFDFGTSFGGTSYITMEFLEGEELSSRIKRLGRLPVRVAVDIACQVASAVGAAHARRITHRDLKPANLFLIKDSLRSGRDQVKVLDFGIAKLEHRPGEPISMKTRTGSVMGTPCYMSPEQCRGSRELDHRTDIYSLGVVLYEMLCGVPPFVSESFGEMVFMQIGVAPPAARSSNPEIPPELEAIVMRLLAKEPDQRFATMGDLERALLAISPRPLGEIATPAVGAEEGVLLRHWLRLAGDRPRTRVSGNTVAVASAATVGLGSLALLLMSEQPRQSSASLVAGRPDRVPTPSPMPRETVRIELVTYPPGATILDQADRLVDFTPYETTRPRTQGTTRLRIEKAGYRSEVVEVPLDRNFARHLALQAASPSSVRKTQARRP